MIMSIIISVLYFAGLFVFLWRICGIMPKNARLGSLVCGNMGAADGYEPKTKELVLIFLLALLFRVLVFLASYAICGLFVSNVKALTAADFLHRYTAGDAQHYIDIAQQGYANLIEDGQYLMLVFFPLYPVLIKLFYVLIPNGMVCALLISWLCYAAGTACMYRLALLDYGRDVSRLSVVLLSVSPFAFFFGAAMTESLFFLTAMLTFYAIRRHNWWFTGISGVFCSLSRAAGALMLIPAFLEWYEEYKPIEALKNHDTAIFKRFIGFLPVFIMLSGTLVYLLINYRVSGDAFVFLKYQSEHWYQNLQFFPKSIKTLTEHLNGDISTAAAIFLPGLISALVSAVIILYSSNKARLMYLGFMLVYFAYNAGASWPISLSRYLCCMFPAYFTLSAFSKKHSFVKYPLIAISAILFGIYFSGFLAWKQIM